MRIGQQKVEENFLVCSFLYLLRFYVVHLLDINDSVVVYFYERMCKIG